MKISKVAGTSLKALTCVALPAGGFAAGSLFNKSVEAKEVTEKQNDSDEFKNLVISDESYKAIKWYLNKKVKPLVASTERKLECIEESTESTCDNGSCIYNKTTVDNCIETKKNEEKQKFNS